MIGDFHIHSKYSFDSIMSPKKIIKIVKKKNIDIIAITDHNTIRGGLETKKVGDDNIRIVIGAEIKTDAGDIIGLNLNDEIKRYNWEDVLDQIKMQEGVSVLSHPYRGHKDVYEVARRVDFIEVWNARSTMRQNELAFDLAKRLGKRMLAGSDAHLYSEIGNVKIFIDDKWDMKDVIVKKRANSHQIFQSQIVGYLRKGEFYDLICKGSEKLFKRLLSKS